MRSISHPEAAAFRHLRRLLTGRRFSQLDLRLKLELGLLALLITGFVFWQVRGAFASIAAQGGAAVLAALLGTWLVLSLLAALLVGARHGHRLRTGAPGPAWLALPAGEPTLARHLAWDSALVASWLAVPAIGIGLAAWGYVAPLVLLALALPLAALLMAACRAGAWIAERWLVLAAGRGNSLADVLARASTRASTRRRPPVRWASGPAWLALASKDARITFHVGSVRRHLLTSLLFWLLSALAWRLPSPPHMTDLHYVSAFVLALLGSAAMGEWLVALSGADPFQTLRTLPIGVGAVWSGRMALALLGVAALLVAHACAGSSLAPHALRLFLAWVGAASVAIATLAVNYGVTLFPRADIARRLLGLSLGLAVAASLMIPLLGWIVLLSAVLHSARRLSRWSRLEEA
jgi:hypothetical protein